MGEYIEREAAKRALADSDVVPKYKADNRPVTDKIIDDIPAADVAPVVHGRWEWLGPNRLVPDCMCGTCSVCKVRSKYIVNTMLCPNCGAKMDGGGSDAAD